MHKENKVQNDVRKLIGGRKDCRIFRNNVGGFKDNYGNFIRFGLMVGSGDQIGWQSITITPDMVGKKIARFLSIECKRAKGGKNEKEQKNWRMRVCLSGGIGIFAKSAESAEKQIDNWDE